MPSFKDKDGNDWEFDFDIAQCESLKNQIGIDFLEPRTNFEAIQKSFAGPRSALETLWPLIASKAQEKGASTVAMFCARFMTLETLGALREVWEQTVRDFIRRLDPQTNEALEMDLKQAEAMKTVAAELMTDDKLTELMRQKVRESLGVGNPSITETNYSSGPDTSGPILSDAALLQES